MSLPSIMSIEVVIGVILGIAFVLLITEFRSKIEAHNTINELTREVEDLKRPHSIFAKEVEAKVTKELQERFGFEKQSIRNRTDEDIARLKQESEVIMKSRDDLERRNLEMSREIDLLNDTFSKIRIEVEGSVGSKIGEMTDELLDSINDYFVGEYTDVEVENTQLQTDLEEQREDFAARIGSKDKEIKELTEKLRAITEKYDSEKSERERIKSEYNSKRLRNLKQYRN